MNSRDKVTREDRSKKKVEKSRPKKRKQYFNPKTVEVDESSFSASRKKLTFKDNIHVPVDPISNREFFASVHSYICICKMQDM